MILAKVCVLGELSVGKTSLVRRFVDRSFSDAYLSTVGVKISRKLLRVSPASGANHVDLQLVIWDLEGGQSFRQMSASYLKGALGAVVVGDVTRESTLEAIGEHIHHFRQLNPDSPVSVALNKNDLHGGPSPLAQIERYREEGIAVARYTSAKTGGGVDELFEEFATHLLNRLHSASSN